MPLCLTTADWMMVSRIVYRVNCLQGVEEVAASLPALLGEAVPYDWGSEVISDGDGQLLQTFGRAPSVEPAAGQCLLSAEMPSSTYLRSLMLDRGARVIRGPSSHELGGCPHADQAPDDPDRALLLLLNHEGESLGYVALFAADGQGFSKRDHCTLEELQPHLSLRVSELLRRQREAKGAGALAEFDRSMARFGLTRRESELLYHLSRGEDDDTVCAELYISKSTFKKHLNHIYQKCDVRNRAELLRLIL